MDAQQLKALQAPLKSRYRNEPATALVQLTAEGSLDGEGITCSVGTARALVDAGLHPATGGDGTSVCSGDMLLEALVACAGVTVRAVATAIDIELRGGTVRAEGLLDFRGTLAVDRDAPVGFSKINLTFNLDTDADADAIANLLKLTERFCVVYQTLKSSPAIEVAHATTKSAASD